MRAYYHTVIRRFWDQCCMTHEQAGREDWQCTARGKFWLRRTNCSSSTDVELQDRTTSSMNIWRKPKVFNMSKKFSYLKVFSSILQCVISCYGFTEFR